MYRKKKYEYIIKEIVMLTANWNINLQCQYILCCDSSTAFLKMGLAKFDWFCCWYSSATTLAASNFTSSNVLIDCDSNHYKQTKVCQRNAIETKKPAASGVPLVRDASAPGPYSSYTAAVCYPIANGFGLQP